MTIRVNPELEALLLAETTQYAQVRALNTALTTTKRIKARRNPDANVAQADVWATGTLFRDAALTGAFTFAGVEIVGYGVTSGLTTSLAADLETGKSVLRIEGGGHWVEGTLGLTGSGADFTLATNPTATNSIAVSPSMQLFVDKSLPDGAPDLEQPEVSLVTSTLEMTSAGPLTLTATATDDIGIVKVEFYRGGALINSKAAPPWTYDDQITAANNGLYEYAAIAYDAVGNSAISAAVIVSVNIEQATETGPATAVGSELTTVSLQSTAGVTQTNVPITFGQVFKVGALPVTSAAVELSDGVSTIIPCQLDVKASHPDGSVRHAVISAIIPSMAANATAAWSIRRKAAPNAGTPPTFASFTGLNATATLTDTGTEAAGPTAGTVYTADAGALITAGQFEQWLSGPIVSEWIVRAPLKTAGGVEHPDLHARFAIRAYVGQTRAKIDYTIEHTWVKPAVSPTVGGSVWQETNRTDRIYKVAFTGGADEVYRRAVNGYQLVRIENRDANNAVVAVFNASATGLANDATVYTATITIDGTAKPISITGSTAQTYSQLKSVIDTQLGGAGSCVLKSAFQALRFESATTGANSTVVITDGTLFPALDMVTKYRPIRGDEVIHYTGTRWKKTRWWGAEPALHIIHNKQYLMDSKAVPNYQAGIVPDPAKIASNLAAMLANEDIGQNGITKAFMGDTGYAPGIGLLPEWSVMWLLSQNKDAKYVMLKMGDQAGAWPVVVREYDNGLPILFSKWPYAGMTGTSGDSANPATGFRELFPASVKATTIPATLNKPDVSHHPDFCFLPYLVTGDHFYMEGMLFYQRYTVFAQSPGATYRDGNKCLWNRGQPRAQGWSMRSAAHTLYLLPDNHPARTDIAYELESNRIWYEANYIASTAQYANPFGFVVHGYGLVYNSNRGGAPWQDDFITQAWGRAVELGFSKMRTFFNYKAKYVTGRLTSGPAFCWQSSAAYSMNFRATSADPYYKTWNEVFSGTVNATVAAAECGTQAMADALAAASTTTPAVINVLANRSNDPGSYTAILQASTAYAATHAVDSGANAWLVFEGRSVKPDYNAVPQFAIAPRA